MTHIEEVAYPKVAPAVYRDVIHIIESLDLGIGLDDVQAIEFRVPGKMLTLRIKKRDTKGELVVDHLGQVRTKKLEFVW